MILDPDKSLHTTPRVALVKGKKNYCLPDLFRSQNSGEIYVV